jgi:SH3 domain-containing YSC84-like protein 1
MSLREEHVFRAAAIAFLLALPPSWAAAESKDKEAERVDDSRVVFQEITQSPDANVPRDLMERAKCVAIFPGMIKGALGWGAKMGRGVISCRGASGKWGPPIFLRITGGSWGLQAGVEKTDVLLFFMNEAGAQSLLKSEFSIGGKGAVAAGPIGRSAEAATDVRLDAEIYSYSRSKGLFAGLSLEGAKVSVDKEAMRKYYGKDANPKSILFDHQVSSVPPSAQALMESLP